MTGEIDGGEVQTEAMPDEAADMAAAYDRIMAGQTMDDEPETGESEPVAEAAPAVEAPPVVDVPTDLPPSLREKWAEIPEAAREAVLSSQRELSKRLAEQGRVSQAIKPTHDALVEAVKQFPELGNMQPAQLARDVAALASTRASLARDPVNTILQVAQQYGVVDALKQAMSGQQVTAQQPQADVMRELRALQQQLQQVANPEYLGAQIQQTLTQAETARMVQEYSTKPHWAEVEGMVAQMIPFADKQLGEGASDQDVLNLAYDMAIHARPDLRAKVDAPAQAQVVTPPAQVKAAADAASINITGKPSKPTPLTERQLMSQAYDRMMRQ